MTAPRPLARVRRRARRPASAGNVTRRAGCLVLVLVVAAVVLNTAFLGGHLWALSVRVSALKQLLAPDTVASNTPRGSQLAGAYQQLQAITTGLAALRWHGAPLLWLCPHLDWLPVYGPDVAAAPLLLDLGDHVTAAALLLLEGVAPAVGAAPPGSSGAPIDRLAQALPALAGARLTLAAAEARLEQAEAAWTQLSLRPLSPQLAEPLNRAGDYLPGLRSAVQLTMLAPSLLGAEGARTYLILAQNEDELRPTGGFITAAGLATLDGGRITRLEFEDSYAIDDLSKPYPDPPEALRRAMLADLWLFRDINWSPDFPTTARAAADAYAYGRGVEVDGVVALDQQALQILLGALGPVTIEATGETVTAAGVIDAIRHHWAPDPGQGLTGEWWLQRKSFLGDLATAVRQRLEIDAGSLDLPAVARAMHQALAGKHLLIQTWQPEVADALQRAGWNGAVGASDGDFLMVVDANVGFNKASSRVSKQIDCRVDLNADGGGQVQLAVEYRHRGKVPVERCVPEVRYDEVYDLMMERCLWNYTRLLVPQDAVLDAGPEIVVPGEAMLSGEPTIGMPDVVRDDAARGTASIGVLFVLAPGQTTSLAYRYHRPEGMARRVDEISDGWRYDLRLQKQPGTSSAPVRVQVTLPPGATLLTSSPVPDEVSGGGVVHELVLSEDRRVSLTYRLAGGRPDGQ